MSVKAKPLIDSKYASNSATAEYQVPTSTRTIIDKFTATNTDSSTQTISVNLIPPGGNLNDSNLIVKTKSISAGATADISELQNQILNETGTITVTASVASKVVIRASGREVT